MAGKGAAAAAGTGNAGGTDDAASGAAAGADAGTDQGGSAAAGTAGAAGAAADAGAAGAADAGAAGAAAGAAAEKSYTKADLDRELAKQKSQFEKDAKKAADQAKLTEDERKDAQLKDLQDQLRMRDAKDDVLADLAKVGAQAPGLMWNAIKGELEFDDKGKVTNLKDLVSSLQADFPDSFGTPKPTTGIDGGKGQQDKGDALTAEKLATMSQAEIAALPWEDVKKAMAAQK